ncbi:MAG: hypothetical protein KBF73_10060 [Flavobacteriales bacterium]|nr:hypothetical protein [Flavobacteriales bacterium]
MKLRKLETLITETRDLLKAAEEEQLMELMQKLNRQLSVRRLLAKEIGSTILK